MTALRKTQIAPDPDAAPFAIRSERASDVVAREALLDACFGENRHMRTCQRLRDGRAPAEGLALSAVRQGLLSRIRSSHRLPHDRERTSNSIGTAEDSKCACGGCFGNSPEDTCRGGVGNFRNATRLVGTLRLWHVSAGGVRALVLGPLAVDPSCRELGVGAALMNHALAAAKARGHGAVVLLGDAPYYARFGFTAEKTGELSLPGPFERDRLLGLELREGALDGAWGMIAPAGPAARQSKPRLAGKLRKLASHAA
ncbi:MAG TPA: N-acetyltransferase [Bradyrhizobium sp.]|nr:N-acetyltransferase [Bradyrhizobium sp.]